MNNLVLGASGMSPQPETYLQRVDRQEEKYRSTDTCHVCGGQLKSAFYAVGSYWTSDIEVDKDKKELKYCTKCGLVYVK